MAVTDLTGTTWVINTRPYGTSISLGSINASINFTSNNTNYSRIFIPIEDDLVDGTEALLYDNQQAYRNSAWYNEAYKTISITGGTDATNTNLINWLEANATQQATSKVSVDLTTLPGWASLSSDTYNITIVAKAENYRDSEPSAAVSVTKEPQEYTDCITFTGETSDFTLAVGGAKEWDGTVEYSTDHENWTEWDGTAVSSVSKKLYLRGSGNTTFWMGDGAQLTLSERAACSGNIQTLLEYANPPTSIPTSDCYHNMFYGCTNLTTAPELPATTLASYCYQHMFSECTNLTQAPELPATTLESDCYWYMFYRCTSLITAPALPSTTLAMDCYAHMFDGCSSLKISATRSTEYPTAWRIPSSGTISSTAIHWNSSMLAGTGGTFTSDPSINTTYYGAWTSSAEEDALAGTWVFNDTVDLSTITKEFSVSFTSNSTDYELFYLISGSTFAQEIQYNGTAVYGGAVGWTDEAYKTITITSKLSEVTDGDTLLAWLQANATKQ